MIIEQKEALRTVPPAFAADAVGKITTSCCKTSNATIFSSDHRLKMELDLQSSFGLHVHSCTHWHPPPSPAFGLIYEGAMGQPR
jgi:hypothetical protein